MKLFQNNSTQLFPSKIYVVAEIGMTHDGSFGLAKNLIRKAAESGADIVKLQWHIACEETIKNAPAPHYFSSESRYDYFSRTEFSQEQFSELVDFCRELGVLSCVSVFSERSLELAIMAGFEIIKIASGEITNLPLLAAISISGLPVIMSSGMSDWHELDEALSCFDSDADLVVLQCTSDYPTASTNVGLNVLSELKERYNYAVGLSDHTLGSGTSVAALCFGASVIEKHFTISKDLYGPDARFSLIPSQFKQMVSDIRFVNECLNNPVDKSDASRFSSMKEVFQKSIVASRFIPKGKIISLDDMAFKKPGTGISASMYKDLIGRKAVRDYFEDEFFTELGF